LDAPDDAVTLDAAPLDRDAVDRTTSDRLESFPELPGRCHACCVDRGRQSDIDTAVRPNFARTECAMADRMHDGDDQVASRSRFQVGNLGFERRDAAGNV
jgi:hypothetical protein